LEAVNHGQVLHSSSGPDLGLIFHFYDMVMESEPGTRACTSNAI